MLMFFETPDELAKRDNAEAPAYWAGWMAYVGALHESGIVKSAAGLQPPSMATTLSLVGGQRQVQDGPFAETKESLGGFFVIDVPSLDAALDWAARAPCASNGRVEVRPVLPPPPGAPT
ncbi:MAG TPA: YciI family protein [Methylibium sp.]|uniref:YciI family protein n=1 Tax=Methylibium sp. TaxID=2067992 RepID=UPI002DBACF45|nr:YciI family protein [Methylibium sp.]HEU4458705.1 YciI family protein [Methylibium sp.]